MFGFLPLRHGVLGVLHEKNMSKHAKSQLPDDTSLLTQGIALYIHIPFCETKCPYCDFNTYAGIESMMTPYVDALCQEIHKWGNGLDHPSVRTIFLGGGTPSYLSPQDIGHILSVACESFTVEFNAEITTEANPSDLTPEKARLLRSKGFNRLSIGVQSLDDDLLHLLGRRHSANQAHKAFTVAREAGFNNINLDLMFGLPGQTMQQWQSSIEAVLAMNPEHLSLYSLTIEPETPFANWIQTGTMEEPDPDLAADMYTWSEDRLESAEYIHYEISNWSKPRLESQHNLIYWRNSSYLGVGPGAHSFLANCRFANVKSPRTYMHQIQNWQGEYPLPINAKTLSATGAIESVEVLDRGTEMGETLMMGLRLKEGISLDSFRARFDVDLATLYEQVIRELEELALVEWHIGSLRLTRKGLLLGNEVFQRFLSASKDIH